MRQTWSLLSWSSDPKEKTDLAQSTHIVKWKSARYLEVCKSDSLAEMGMERCSGGRSSLGFLFLTGSASSQQLSPVTSASETAFSLSSVHLSHSYTVSTTSCCPEYCHSLLTALSALDLPPPIHSPCRDQREFSKRKIWSCHLPIHKLLAVPHWTLLTFKSLYTICKALHADFSVSFSHLDTFLHSLTPCPKAH